MARASYRCCLRKAGLSFSALDISPETIKVARRRAELNNVADRIDCRVAVAEDLPFDDETFDIGFGLAILHHLDVDLAPPSCTEYSRLEVSRYSANRWRIIH